MTGALMGRDAGQLALTVFALGNETAMIALTIMATFFFLAWVVSSDARTRRLSSLLRSRNGGGRR
ncbi:hypothetical protein FsymDg_4163 [Candidatus Protofrankia datiscae]|uniref:Uncharacterized protein n=2 Tax=Candidatus Protofrankia datiscae TaxID=2716812 RepID=F8AWY7_9ACTN|nr:MULTISPECIES: hypothetical protein [Protofrankia]AEH11431.1 hypothetical protein FsymDg_4163 [Candidatus Protofrankia datiscae]